MRSQTARSRAERQRRAGRRMRFSRRNACSASLSSMSSSGETCRRGVGRWASGSGLNVNWEERTGGFQRSQGEHAQRQGGPTTSRRPTTQHTQPSPPTGRSGACSTTVPASVSVPPPSAPDWLTPALLGCALLSALASRATPGCSGGFCADAALPPCCCPVGGCAAPA